MAKDKDISEQEVQAALEQLTRARELARRIGDRFRGEDMEAIGMTLALLASVWVRGHYCAPEHLDEMRNDIIASHAMLIKRMVQVGDEAEKAAQKH